MQGIGGFLMLMGAGSFVLNLIGMEFRLLMWIDLWGPTVGMAIRIGLMVVGALLFFLGLKAEESHAAGQSEDLSKDATRHL